MQMNKSLAMAADVPSAPSSGGMERVRAFLRYVVVLLMCFSYEFALAQSVQADCDVVTQAATSARDRAVAAIDERDRLTAQAIENAKSCIDRILMTIRAMTPGVPGIVDVSIQQIIDYMSNRLCAIATQAVTSAAGQVLNPINGAINGAVGDVNGAIGGALPPGAPMPGLTTSTGTTTTPRISPTPAPVGGSNNTGGGGGVFNRLACQFGGGTNCPN